MPNAITLKKNDEKVKAFSIPLLIYMQSRDAIYSRALVTIDRSSRRF